jgi:hypothetical protein
VNDPARRKANTATGEGSFVTQFKAREDSRWVFGSFERSGVTAQIRHFKALGIWENSIGFTAPEAFSFGPDVERLVGLFNLTNERLRAFYAYADLKDIICAKKPSTPSLDISRELLGVFWLTYFGEQYCRFFGRDKVTTLSAASPGPGNGVTLRLAPSAAQTSDGLRQRLEGVLGAESFAGNGGVKARGQFAMTLAQLASELVR